MSQRVTPWKEKSRKHARAGEAWDVMQTEPSLCQPRREHVAGHQRGPTLDKRGWGLARSPRKACPEAHCAPRSQASGPFWQEDSNRASLCQPHKEEWNHCRVWKAPVGFISEFTPHRTTVWEANCDPKGTAWAWSQTIGILKSRSLTTSG